MKDAREARVEGRGFNPAKTILARSAHLAAAGRRVGRMAGATDYKIKREILRLVRR